jgi:hypothetical protein
VGLCPKDARNGAFASHVIAYQEENAICASVRELFSQTGNIHCNKWRDLAYCACSDRWGARMPRYFGKVCATHPELRGERRNGNCPACQRERGGKRSKPSREVQRRKVRKWRAANAQRHSEGKLARNAALRAKAKGASDTPPDIRRAWIALSRQAKRLGRVVDHIVPIAGCRACSARGAHAPSNWQLLTTSDNSSKGNRCMSCWERDMLSKSLSTRR